MSDKSENNKRIIKNTIFLYCRMFLIMAVSLYTSRVILKTLGVEDFGIYNLVAGIVVLFTFFNKSMTIASQRFLSYALGENNSDKLNHVFVMCIITNIILALVVLIFSETIGIYFLNRLNIPPDRNSVVFWVYQISILTCITNIVRIPFNALIIAHEQMSFYAWLSIIEAFLKLLIVYLLTIFNGDKLLLYTLFLFGVTIIINIAYISYCFLKFKYIRIKFFWDKDLFKKIISFSGWSLSESFANVGTQQGTNIALNLYSGVVANAAYGISNQVMGAVGLFLYNFQSAFNPQMVKSYAAGDMEYFQSLIFKTSKLSYYLMFLISVPILLYCNFFLDIWLDSVPHFTTEFTQLLIVFLLFDAIAGPMWIAIQATGNIRIYQIVIGTLIILNVPISFLLLYLGLSPVYVFVVRVIINCISVFFRLFYLKHLISFPSLRFLSEVMKPILLVTITAIPIPLLVKYVLDSSWISVLIVSIICILTCSISIFLLGLDQKERGFVLNHLKRILLKCR